MIDDLLEIVLDLGTEIRGSFVKILGWLLLGIGLAILAEPVLGTGLLAEQFSQPTLHNNLLGSGVMALGAVMLSGIPSFSGIWDKIEYGGPLLAFFLGVTFIYISTWGTENFIKNVLGYSVIASISVMLIGIIRMIYSAE